MFIQISFRNSDVEMEYEFKRVPSLNEILSYHCNGKITRYRVITVSGGLRGKGEFTPTGIRVEPIEQPI